MKTKDIEKMIRDNVILNKKVEVLSKVAMMQCRHSWKVTEMENTESWFEITCGICEARVVVDVDSLLLRQVVESV